RSARAAMTASKRRNISEGSGAASAPVNLWRGTSRIWASSRRASSAAPGTPAAARRLAPWRSASAPVMRLDPFRSSQARGLIVGGQRIDDLAQITLNDAVQRIKGQANAMIGHPPLRKAIGADAFGTVARSDLRLAISCTLSISARAFQIVKPGAQHGHGVGAVLVLGLFRTGHDDTGRQVGDAHRRIGRVDVLAARTAGPHGVDANVIGWNLD